MGVAAAKERVLTVCEGRPHGTCAAQHHCGGDNAARARVQPHNLANTAWVYATACHAAAALLDAIVAAAAPRMREFDPQALVNTALAFIKAGHAAPTLLDAITAEAAPRLLAFDVQGLADTAWAYMAAGPAAPALLDAIAAEAVSGRAGAPLPVPSLCP